MICLSRAACAGPDVRDALGFFIVFKKIVKKTKNLGRKTQNYLDE